MTWHFRGLPVEFSHPQQLGDLVEGETLGVLDFVSFHGFVGSRKTVLNLYWQFVGRCSLLCTVPECALVWMG